MSHFTVLVIGGNVDEQLAPYDENIQVAPYKKSVVSKEEKQRMFDYYKMNEGLDFKTFDECYAEKGDDWNGNSWVKEGNKYVEYSSYNPNSKWDWYVIGGRWSGFFKLKPDANNIDKTIIMGNNNMADQCMKGSVDYDGMTKDAIKNATEVWNKANALFAGETLEHWDSVLNRIADINEARHFYNNQSIIKRFNNSKDFGIWYNAENYDMPLDQYVQNRANEVLSTFAVVKDGIWYEQGKMGWWGMVTDKITQNEWNEKFKELLNSVSDDTVLTLIDCHI